MWYWFILYVLYLSDLRGTRTTYVAHLLFSLHWGISLHARNNNNNFDGNLRDWIKKMPQNAVIFIWMKLMSWYTTKRITERLYDDGPISLGEHMYAAKGSGAWIEIHRYWKGGEKSLPWKWKKTILNQWVDCNFEAQGKRIFSAMQKPNSRYHKSFYTK